jgi:hypothetical protein
MQEVGPKQMERLETTIETGAKAEQARGSIVPYLQERRESIIQEMLGWFRGAEETFDAATSIKYVAALNEVEALLEQIHREIEMGKRAQQKLYGDPTATQSA